MIYEDGMQNSKLKKGLFAGIVAIVTVGVWLVASRWGRMQRARDDTRGGERLI